MTTLIGREREKSMLDKYYKSGKAEFIAIYGRRRIGKTFLIRKYFNNDFSFDMTGVLEGGRSEQMTAFHSALQSYGYKGKKNATWLDAFYALRQLLETKIESGKRCVIFIDELPCLDTHKAGFVNALGHFWNSWANWQSEIMLIICGSATSWMVRNVIDNHGGLHDRITHEIHLHPFTLAETEKYFEANGFLWERLSILQTYMAIGGVPYYMGLFDKSESPAMGLDRLFFSENADLKSEYKRLFYSLFKNAQPYIEIVNALAQRPQGMNRDELASVLKCQNNGKLGDMLTDLVYCDFLRKNEIGGGASVKKNGAIYQLVDFYTIFYNTFISKSNSDEHYWSHNIGNPVINTWFGLTYEKVCKMHISQIKEALGISGINTKTYSWRSKNSETGAQIDIMIERADNTINLCEVKYSDKVYTLDKDEYLKIVNRRDVFRSETKTTFNIIPVLITTFGCSENGYGNMINIKLDMNCLFG